MLFRSALLGGLLVNFPREIVKKFALDDALIKRRVFASAVLARIVHEEFALADARRRKSIRLNDVCTGFEKAAVDVTDRRRLRERIQITVVLQILLGIRKPFAANFLFAQPVAADGCAHRAINDDDAFLQSFEQQLRVGTIGFGLVHGRKLAQHRQVAKLKIIASGYEDMICMQAITPVFPRPHR